MLEWFLQAVQENEVMQAALVAAPVTALTYAVRNIPFQIYHMIKGWVSYDLTFKSDNDDFNHVNSIIHEEVINSRFSRDFIYENVSYWNEEESRTDTLREGVTIGYGTHWGWFGQPVVVRRKQEENHQGDDFKETVTITFFGFGRKNVDRFGDLVTKRVNMKTSETRVEVRISSGGDWGFHGSLSPRPWKSVFTSKGEKDRLLDHCRKFETSREQTLAKGLRWHTGILLTGTPGTGKTSLIHALASELGRSIRFLNLSGVSSDREIVDLMSRGSRRWNDTILVIEDIDVANAAVSRDDTHKKVSLSSLLNILDGFLTPEGLVTIATTNHPESLDPALVRSGRFDFKAELGPLEWEEANKMSLLLTGNRFGTPKESYVPIVGAKLREQILKNNMSL